MQNRLHPLINKDLSEIKEHILGTLAYFDLFNYPLTRTEVYLFLKKKYTDEVFDDSLKCLADGGIIYQFDGFYCLHNDPELISRRNEGNKKATELIKVAKTVGNILIWFPYVRGVAISGSLSKNFADEHSDIDLFIITANNRLWIARTIMHCFKKLTFLVNKEHYFCMNYYVDEQQLEICEKNIYTAIEIATLIPLQGDIIFENFFAANSWTRGFLPNKYMRVASAKPIKMTILKRLVNWLPENPANNMIDNILMKVTARRWAGNTKLQKLNSKGVVLAMAADKHFSKPDPRNFQSKLLARYSLKVAEVFQQHENSLAN